MHASAMLRRQAPRASCSRRPRRRARSTRAAVHHDCCSPRGSNARDCRPTRRARKRGAASAKPCRSAGRRIRRARRRRSSKRCVQDVRYGVRAAAPQPGFTLTAVLTLALGIGANSAIFSVASGVLLRPLPYPTPDRLAMVWMDNARIELARGLALVSRLLRLPQQSTTFDGHGDLQQPSRTLTGDGEPERVLGRAQLGQPLRRARRARPSRGRVYTADEDTAGANAVVVLSHGLWQRRFGGRDDASAARCR